MRRRLFWFAKFFLIFYVALVAILFFFQRELLYRPSASYISAADANLPGVRELTLKTADKVELRAWYQPPASPEGRTVIFFHGNGGRLATYAGIFRHMAGQGLGFLAVTYRGYPGSQGSPSEQGLYEDGRAAMRYVAERLAIPPEKRILMGLSLGTGVAVQMATEFSAGLLVLVAPFTSISDVAGGIYWYVPVRYLLKDPYDSYGKIKRIGSMPLLVFHSSDDALVPYALGKRLYDAAPGEKKLFTLEEQGHNNLDFDFILKEVAAYRASMLASAGEF